MELSIPIRSLAAAIRLVKPDTNHFSPQVVQLSTGWGTLQLTVASSSNTTSFTVPAQVADSGDVVVGYKEFAAAVKGKGDIVLRSAGEVLEARNGITSHIRVAGANEVTLPDEEPSHLFALDADAIADVLPAASSDDARPFLSGVYLNGTDVVATDSYRLHIARFGTPYGGPSTFIPRNVAAVLAKIGGIGTIGLGTTTTVVTLGSYTCRFRTPDGSYPKYDQLIPKVDSWEQPSTLKFNPAELAKALGSMKASSKKWCAPVRFAPGSPLKLTVTKSDNLVEAEVPGTLDTTETVAYNAEFLSDLVANMDTNTMRVHPLKPAVIEAYGPRWQQIRLIMPVRIG